MTQLDIENQPDTNATRKAPKDNRSLSWAAILYPESLPENWLQLLEDMMVPGFVSPEHSLDLNPDGEPKKPHFHLLLKFATKKSFPQVSSLLEPLNGSKPQRINDFRSYARYLCHLDNPSKAQYEREQVISLCGLVYDDVVGTSADRLAGIHEMMSFCNENELYSFSELCDYAAEHRRDWFRLLCDNSAHIMVEYLKSKTWTAESEKLQQLRHLDEQITRSQEYLEELERDGVPPRATVGRGEPLDDIDVLQDQYRQFAQDCIVTDFGHPPF